MNIRSVTLLDAVSTSGAGAAVQLPHYAGAIDVFISASGVTAGATVQVEVQGPDGNWYPLLSSSQASITASGQHGPYHAPVGYTAVRGNITSLSDGTYTVTALVRSA